MDAFQDMMEFNARRVLKIEWNNQFRTNYTFIGICHHITGTCKDGCESGWKGAECLEIQDDGNTSTYMYKYAVVAAISVSVISIILNVVQLLYIILQRRQKVKQKNSKAYEQTKKENVFSQDVSGYDSVAGRTEDNYQELAAVTADR